MKKGKGIGIAAAVIVISLVVGIASLPDEVSLESPNLENSGNTISPASNLPDVELPPTPIIEETPEEEDGKVIQINIRDGIGAGFK